MRLLGKCDGCRQQKVKCDEQKPSCGNCKRERRPCNYAHGQAFTVVIQDPSQMTKYGKSLIEPVLHPLDSSQDYNKSRSSGSASTPFPALASPHASDPSQLHLTSGTLAEDGRGVFHTFAPVKAKIKRKSKKLGPSQRKRVKCYLFHLQQETSLAAHRPSSPETKLASMFIDMLCTHPQGEQPLLSLGDWITSIPSRIGSSEVVTMATEFFVHSFGVSRDGSHSNRTLALQTKGNAMKELQMSVLAKKQQPTYDLLTATKLHYAAEILLGVDSIHYAIHTLGLMDLLKQGKFSNADKEHFWSVINSTYIDDITVAMPASRVSLYENDFYLSSTHPAALLNTSLSATQKSNRVAMHVLIQCPRFIVLIRHAISNPDDMLALASAISMAENLWQLTQGSHFAELINSSTATVHELVDDAVIDMLPHCLRFTSTQGMIFCTRYWFLQVILYGMIDTLYRHFPEAYGLSFLPNANALHCLDTDAGTQLEKVLLELDTASSPLLLTLDGIHDIATAERMKTWLLSRCNKIQARLGISAVDERAWLEALDGMAGEEMPDWIPTKVSFGSEDGELVMKLEYGDGISSSDYAPRVFSIRAPGRFGLQELKNWMQKNNFMSKHKPI
ncbi:hypothetical protein EJ07DRAFT_135018 [Lizonia empirigonia]|nr:hypothetical protein EJ07DRAFT_135018 [Lizonia empirigonia]